MDRMVLNVDSTCPYAAPHLTVCRSLMRCLLSARLFVTRVRPYGWISHNFAIRINSAEVHVRSQTVAECNEPFIVSK